jgi:hypothetical protein
MQWFLALPDVSTNRGTTVAKRRRRDLRHADGRLLVEVRNEYETTDGQRRGDVYVAWRPNEEEN